MRPCKAFRHGSRLKKKIANVSVKCLVLNINKCWSQMADILMENDFHTEQAAEKVEKRKQGNG